MVSHHETKMINGKRVTSPEYRSWQMMRNRCLNLNSKDAKYYSLRGITIDPRWNNFVYFLADMGRRPQPTDTLERKEGDKGYCKSNCEWATRQKQSRNRAYVKLSLEKARLIRHDPRSQAAIATAYGVSQSLISSVKRGVMWAEEMAAGP
jgi:hypothetical protein